MKLLISTPSARDYKFQFATSMMNLMNYVNGKGVNGDRNVTLHLQMQANASLLSAARENAFQMAIDEGFDYLLMVDDDMIFPVDTVDRLMGHGKDVVAVNYISKGPGGLPTAMNDDGKVFSAGKAGLEEVGWIGLGVCLVRMAAVKDIPAPRFEVVWLPETKTYLGEDYHMSEILRRHGVALHIDHDLSHDVGHIGDYVYRE